MLINPVSIDADNPLNPTDVDARSAFIRDPDGNIVQLDSSYLQILKITRSEEDDKLMVNINYALNIRNAQDDLLITAK